MYGVLLLVHIYLLHPKFTHTCTHTHQNPKGSPIIACLGLCHMPSFILHAQPPKIRHTKIHIHARTHTGTHTPTSRSSQQHGFSYHGACWPRGVPSLSSHPQCAQPGRTAVALGTSWFGPTAQSGEDDSYHMRPLCSPALGPPRRVRGYPSPQLRSFLRPKRSSFPNQGPQAEIEEQ